MDDFKGAISHLHALLMAASESKSDHDVDRYMMASAGLGMYVAVKELDAIRRMMAPLNYRDVQDG